MRQSVSCLLIVLLIVPGFAQQKPAFELTVDNIMRGNALTGYSPQGLRWSGDSQRVYFEWKQYDQPREKSQDTYVVNRDNTGLRKLSEDEDKLAPPVRSEQTKDEKRGVFVEDGDLFLYDYATDKRRRLTRTNDAETNPRFSRDEKHIVFTRSSTLYKLSLEDGELEQLTDIRAAGAAPAATPPAGGGLGGFFGQQQQRGTAPPAAEKKGTDSQEALKKQEKELLDVIKRRAARREEDEAKRKKENPRKPFNLTGRQTVANLTLAPDDKTVIAVISEPGQDTKNTIVPNYVTEDSYTVDIPSRNKVGDNQNRNRIGLLSVETGEVKWIDHGQKDGERPRDVQIVQPVWSEDGSKAVMMGRSSDNKDRWILALDPATGKTRVLFTDHDDAWVGGPGGQTLGWMKDNQHIYFQSEKTGYSHLYTMPFAGGDPRALTSGKWEVTSVQLSNDKTKFYLTTSEVSAYERHVYVMAASGGERTKLTSAPGFNQAVLSPDEKSLALIYSFTNKPPEVYLQENRPGVAAVKVTSSPAPDFWNYAWLDAPIVEFPARDGVAVPARIFKPKNWKAGGPGVIFVHGAGYAQNVHRGWTGNGGPYLFHHLLMERGYFVMDVDYRASAGYGRDWRTAIYRFMGGKDLDDQVDAARWMVKEQGVDAKRLGIYGGSYGGFMTLMAMFTAPDVFAAGAALRPVTDWSHYNHPYTSNILNLPQKDQEAYRKSSPIHHAQGLKGALLICHGIVDTNVHFQDTVRLVQRLIELRKENWELAVYPVEDHGFVEPTSWADEYKRILKLFETTLKPAPVAAAKGKRG